MINPVVYRFIKKAYASDQEILDVASQYYDNDDPEDPKRRWDHVLDDIEVAKKIRGRDLTPVELGTLAFHDSGYKNPKGYMWGLKNHPKLSRKILLKEAPGLGFKDDEIKHMAKVISYHMRTPKKGSPLLKDDLQMLMFGADEGTPKKPVDDARKYFMKAVAGRYPEVPDKSDPQFVKKLVERVRTFKDYSNAPGLEYYHRVYPNYHRDLYNYWHSDQIIKDYEKMLEDEKKGKSLKQKGEKKKTVKKASVDISDIVNAYKEQYGFDLSHMKGKHSKKPRYNNGKIAKDIPVESYGGSWAKNNTIYLNPDMDAVAKYYGLDNTDDLRKTIVAHELAHEIYNKQATKEYIKKIVDEAKKKKFTTAYLKTVPDHKIDEETFCEYLANGLNKKASKLYTYVDPDADLSQGLLSARLAPEDVLMRRYPNSGAKNKKELLEMMQTRFKDDKDRPDLIYALSSPIPDTANSKLLRFRDTHKLVSYNTEDIKDLVKILKRRYRKPPVEVKDVENKKYIQWGRKPKDGGAFFYAPVYKVLTESGIIPPELLTEEEEL